MNHNSASNPTKSGNQPVVVLEPWTNNKKLLLFVLKCAVSVSLITWLLYKTDIQVYVDLLHHSSPLFLSLALILTVASILISAYKWQLLTVAQGHKVSLRTLTATYFVGLFFNNFMPTSIGGDVVRVYDLRKQIQNGADAAASVVAERVLAAFTLALVVAAGVALGPSYLAKYRALVLVFSLLCCGALLFLLFANRLSVLGSRFNNRFVTAAYRVGESLRSCTSNVSIVARVLLYSLIFQLIVVAINLLIIKALGLDVPFSLALIAIPIISVVTMLPISMNGLGLREASYIYFFSYAGLAREEAITVSICFFLVVTLVSLIGGVIFASRK